jgi:proteic killer suppression protein
MIVDFAHKGLKNFFETGTTKGVQADHEKKLRLILGLLDAADDVADMNFHGSRLHKFQGKQGDLWSVTVNGNWRIVFEFKDGNAYIVNYLDYH